MATQVSVHTENPARTLCFPMWAYVVAPWLTYAGLNILWLSGNWPAPLGPAAVVLALFGPGLALIPALFGGAATFDAAETLALAASLSLAVGGIAGVALAAAPPGFRLSSYLGIMLGFTSLCLVVGYLRRNQGAAHTTAGEQAVEPSAAASSPVAWKQRDWLTALLSFSLAAITLFGAITLAGNLQQPASGPYFTEFYLLDANGKLESFPESLGHGEPVQLWYGIDNHEAVGANYQVCIRMDGQLLSCTDSIHLHPNQSYEGAISLDLQHSAGKRVRAEFVLMRGSGVYRTLHLWIHAGR